MCDATGAVGVGGNNDLENRRRVATADQNVVHEDKEQQENIYVSLISIMSSDVLWYLSNPS